MSFLKAKIVCKSANPDDYHTQEASPGDKDFVVSSSMLRLFSQCPSRWKRGYESPDSGAKRFGSLLDCRLLTPESFETRFSVQPETYDAKKDGFKPWNNNANVCKDWKKLQAGKEIISASELSESDAAFKRLRGDEIIAAWVDCSDKQVWLSAEWKDDKTGLVVPIKALLDFVPRKDTEFQNCLGDLKCVRSGSLIPFQRQVYQLGWHIQAALYQDVYVAATKEDRNTFCIVGVENYPPFEPIRRMFSQAEGSDIIGIGRMTYQHALKRYCACLKSGKWPGYDDHADAVQGWSLINAEPWMEFEFVSKAMEADQVDALEENADVPMP